MKLPNQRTAKKKERKILRKASVDHGILFKETIWVLLESQEEKRGRRWQKLFKEIMTENFLNLGRDLDIQVHEAQLVSKQVQL